MMRTLSLMLFAVMILVSAISPAAGQIGEPVPWTTESYRAYAYTDTISNSNPQSVEAFGPPLPVSANQYLGPTKAQSYIDSEYMTVFALSMSTSEISNAIAEFTGSYTALKPYFLFSYTFPGYYEWSMADGWLTITDTDSSTVLYDYTFTDNDTGAISVNTPLGHNIEVNFGINAFAAPFNFMENARLDYAMAVAPEPASMILFGIGGVVLAGRRLKIRKRQN